MMIDQRLYQKGEYVGTVDLAAIGGPLEVPIPSRWYMLRVHPNREARVMKAFRRRNISAWLPLMQSTQDVTRYRRGFEYRSRQTVVYPMITGVIILPDFELAADRWREVDGVIGIYRMADCTPHLTPADVLSLRQIEAIAATPKSKRAHLFEIGELVRVANGPFRSFGARVERFDSKGRLTIGVEIFGRITPITVSGGDIEKV